MDGDRWHAGPALAASQPMMLAPSRHRPHRAARRSSCFSPKRPQRQLGRQAGGNHAEIPIECLHGRRGLMAASDREQLDTNWPHRRFCARSSSKPRGNSRQHLLQGRKRVCRQTAGRNQLPASSWLNSANVLAASGILLARPGLARVGRAVEDIRRETRPARHRPWCR